MISSYNYIDPSDIVDIPPMGVINSNKVYKIKTPKFIIYKNMPTKLSKNQTANISMKLLKGK